MAPELITSIASTPSGPRRCSPVTGLKGSGAKGRKPACRSRGWFSTTTRSPGAERIPRSSSRPLGGLRVRGLRAGREGEGVEVPDLRRDLVADDRREPAAHAHAIGGRGEVGSEVVMVGGDRQLDPLAGQSDGPFVERGVAVAAVGQRVDVRVAGDQARGRDLSPDRQVHAPILALGQVHRPGVDPVLEATGGVDAVTSRRQADSGLSVRGVDDAGPRRQAGSRCDDERSQGAAIVHDRDPAGKAGIPAGLGNADLEPRAAQGLAHRAGIEHDSLDDHVVRLGRRADRQDGSLRRAGRRRARPSRGRVPPPWAAAGRWRGR